MTVPKSERDQSRMEYVYRSAVLARKTAHVCSKLPKRWTFTRTQFILKAANDVLSHNVRANAIYAVNAAESEQRVWHLHEAVGSACELMEHANLLMEDRPGTDQGKPYVADGLLVDLVRECERVVRLTKGVIKADRAKWRWPRRNRRMSRK